MPPRKQHLPANPFARLLADKESREWIREHEDELPFTGYLPYSTNYTKIRGHDAKYVMDTIEAGMPYTKPAMQKLAELYLQLPPRQVATELGLDRSQVYERIRDLKTLAFRKLAKSNDKLINARDGKADLDAPPSFVFLKQRRLSYRDQVRVVYFVERFAAWVDESGALFPAEIQDILNNYEEDVAMHAQDEGLEEV